MEQLLQYFIFIPLIGFIVSFFFSSKQERLLSGTTYSLIGLQLISIIAFIVYWILQGAPTLDVKHYVFFKEDDIEIFLDFYFDKTTAVFALLGALITFLVVVFSKYYLHRDQGYKRFFNTLLLFFFGYNIAVFAGNFETLFIGWEFLGITSFLLIAFYRDRYLPVKNALKTISFYRLGDICLILALWMNHHVWHENITFLQLTNVDLVAAHIQEYYPSVIFIIAMLIVSASIKSAQFPFSSWLPRAMEGPTTSSAVFYGSLSVHLGVFLMLRTYPFWESILTVKIIVITIGVLTAIVGTLIARVQSSVKTQIAYSAIAQIGLMFIEVALGWHVLALMHLAGNALLRTYQLLVSPSVLGYMIHDQFFNYVPKQYGNKGSFLNKLSNSIYVLSIKEWNMDAYLKIILWNPFKFVGNKLHFLSKKIALIILAIVFIVGLLFFYFDEHIPYEIDEKSHLLFAFIGMLLILAAFVEKKNALRAWSLIIISQLYSVLAIALLNDKYEYTEILLYASGITFAAIVGAFNLRKLNKAEGKVDLNDFYGHIYDHPKWAFWFLIACLAFVSLPFTPSFIGIDLMFSHIEKGEYFLIAFTTINFLVLELTVLRIYARLFLGPNKKQTHPIAYRSS
jgi:NADH-quinone oxidoreductase subunit L